MAHKPTDLQQKLNSAIEKLSSHPTEDEIVTICRDIFLGCNSEDTFAKMGEDFLVTWLRAFPSNATLHMYYLGFMAANSRNLKTPLEQYQNITHALQEMNNWVLKHKSNPEIIYIRCATYSNLPIIVSNTVLLQQDINWLYKYITTPSTDLDASAQLAHIIAQFLLSLPHLARSQRMKIQAIYPAE